MGSSSSKFRKHLQNGDEVAALNVYNNHSDLRKGLDPNCSYGDNFQHETPLHYATRHGMKSLLRIFLYEHGGNPNKTNARKETALHCVCMEKHAQYYPVQRKRLECLTMLLQWRGAELKDGETEKADLSALDEKDNTALHYAALSGLKSCVEMLVTHGCPLFIENEQSHTPCDCAESSGYNDIALYLESKMVFSSDANTGDLDEIPPEIDSEEYSGLRAQDLQEAKDQLLVETADMLSIPLFTAEALLRNYEWSREMLLDAWMANPVACCEKSGVTPPANLFSEKPVVAESLSTPTLTHPPSCFAECDICTMSFQMNEEPVHMSCHQFCRDCWEGYLNVKIKEGGIHDITCPGYGCGILVPVEVIENVVSRDMARRYLQFDIKAFVDSNPNIKWCPYPGCGRAVKFPDNSESSQGAGASPRHSKIPNDTSRAVDCGNGHHFCWECGGEAHEPCSCDNLCKWMGEISEIRPEKLHDTDTETETAANCLWLVTNSKSCPNCKSPIQKNEGCNHMKCSKCKHDFCWVCLDQWKRHNSSTGGYFKCNRYEVSKKIDDTNKSAIADAEVKNTKMQELNKFVHYYTRYKNHENSFKLEEPLLKTAKEKMLKLAEAVTDLATAKDETKFVEEAVHKLLKARRVLKYSYTYGYYLDGPPYRKIVFEFMQTELEECTEILSQMVNRLYLRTPRKKIIDQSYLCHRKRMEFLTAISKGLVPPETPPGMRKKRRKYSMDTEDEDLRKAIMASIEDFDPDNPWIVDASGRHTNLAAMLEWPSDDSDDDSDIVPSKSTNTNTVSGAPPDSPLPDLCLRDTCSRPRAKNPRTGEFHDFCSLRCSRLHKQRKEEVVAPLTESQLDEQMDFLRALEMSRLQYLKEQGMGGDASRTDSSGEAGEPAHPRKLYDQDIYTPSERLDIEIKRLLELSALEPDDADDTKRKLSDTSLPDQSTSSGEDCKPAQQNLGSRFGDQSTIVSRVPNKSVEDLYHPDCIGCQGLAPLGGSVKHSHPVSHSQDKEAGSSVDDDALGACGGKDDTVQFSLTADGSDSDIAGLEMESAAVDDVRVEGKILQKLLNTDKIDKQFSDGAGGSCSGANVFGIIKDLSVSNIDVGEADKTKDFSKKDLSGLSKPKTKVVERGNGRLFAANTPGEDEKVFSLISPESDFSESSSSEVWGYRPQVITLANQGGTPETDSSVDGCSYADLPNQNEHYRFDSTSEASPVIGDECKTMNVIGSCSPSSTNQIGSSGQSSTNQLSIMEMTENLLQMTLAMQSKFDKNLSSQRAALNNSSATPPAKAENEQNLDEIQNAQIDMTTPPSGSLECQREATECTDSGAGSSNEDCVSAGTGGCELIDLEQEPVVAVETETTETEPSASDNGTEESRSITDNRTEESRSTYV